MIDVNDIVGNEYGYLTVIRYLEKKKRNHYYLCRCFCGNEVAVQRGNLMNGSQQSCGCMRGTHVDVRDLIGQRFGKLTVLEYVGKVPEYGGKPRNSYRCLCACGNECVVSRKNLVVGKTTTCGSCYKVFILDDIADCTTSNKEHFCVDICDLNVVQNHIFHINRYGYPVTRINNKNIQLTHLLLDVPEGMLVDHINGNPLDNRRSNLRLATHGDNQANMGMSRHNTSGYKGVSFRKERGKYRAYISLDDKYVHLGHFDTDVDAARAYDEAARFYFGEFACVNFPLPGEQCCRRNQETV